MATHLCSNCGEVVEGEAVPRVCPRCLRPAREVYGGLGNGARGGSAAVVQAIPSVRTLELADDDLVAAEGGSDGAQPAGAVERADEPGEGRAQEPESDRGLALVRTLELADEDVELASSRSSRPGRPRLRTPPPPLPGLARSKLAARVVVDSGVIEPAPPPLQRRPSPLTSQTETLADGMRTRRRRRLMVVFWVGAVAVAGIGVYRLLTAIGGEQVATSTASAPPLLVQVIDSAAVEIEPAGAANGGIDAGGAATQPTALTDDGGGGSRQPPAARVSRRSGSWARSHDAGAALEDLAQRLYQQGLQHLLVNEPNRAIVLFNRLLRRDPDFALAYRGLGLAHEKLGRKALARASYDRYLILQPNARDAVLIRKRIQQLE